MQESDWNAFKEDAERYFLQIALCILLFNVNRTCVVHFYGPFGFDAIFKKRCLFLIVFILPHAEFGPNDHRYDAPYFIEIVILIAKALAMIIISTLILSSCTCYVCILPPGRCSFLSCPCPKKPGRLYDR